MSDTPHYQAIMDAIAAVFAQENANPGSVGIDRIRELSILARTVMPNMTAADIVAIGSAKFEALTILAAATDEAINLLSTDLQAQMNTLHAGISQDINNLDASVRAAINQLRATSETAINDLYTAKAAMMETLTSDKTNELTGIIDTAKLAALSEISAAEATAIANVGGGREAMDQGILIADFTRFIGQGPFSYTSQLPQTYHSNQMDKLFKLLLGMGHDSERVRHNRVPRQLLPFSDDANAVGVAQQYTEYAQSGNQQNYPTFNIAAIFLKNPTDAEISTSLNYCYSTHWGSGHEGAQLFRVLPNANDDNRAAISDLTYSQLWNVTNSTVTSRAQSISVPAKTTAAFVLACSEHYWTSSSGYQFVKECSFFNLPTLRASGLEIDGRTAQQAFLKNNVSDFAPWKNAA
ncbi:hypothetical protein [Roseibium sp.]|uniref:hypothetical protein n=1 Tax=Roseibium sp. TaxID=1936156 RepID=UPI003D124962